MGVARALLSVTRLLTILSMPTTCTHTQLRGITACELWARSSHTPLTKHLKALGANRESKPASLMRSRLIWYIAGCVIGLVSVAGIAATVQSARAVSSDGLVVMVINPPSKGNPQSPANPLTATLTMPFVPGINQPALLVITVGAVQEAPNTQVELVLPPGASVVQGADHWQVALRPGKTETLTTTIQFGRTGEQEVLVRLRNPLDANNAFVGEGALGLTIEEKTGHVGFGPGGPQPGAGRCLSLPALAGLSGLVWVVGRRRTAKEGGAHTRMG